jgi:hypothetical protein
MIERKELSREEVARRAYGLHLERGGKDGKDVEDWVRAENELRGEAAAEPAKTRTATAGDN